ncbi:MAG: hypothetical protein IKA36_03510 [Clostridia bacterium]|nr:hypothetical protein [Clostridia bacterium]
MGLVNRIAKYKIERNIKKRSKLVVKLQDKQKEYYSMCESLKGSPVHLDFVHKYWEERIANLEEKIVRMDKKIEADALKYNERNSSL